MSVWVCPLEKVSVWWEKSCRLWEKGWRLCCRIHIQNDTNVNANLIKLQSILLLFWFVAGAPLGKLPNLFGSGIYYFNYCMYQKTELMPTIYPFCVPVKIHHTNACLYEVIVGLSREYLAFSENKKKKFSTLLVKWLGPFFHHSWQMFCRAESKSASEWVCLSANIWAISQNKSLWLAPALAPAYDWSAKGRKERAQEHNNDKQYFFVGSG